MSEQDDKAHESWMDALRQIRKMAQLGLIKGVEVFPPGKSPAPEKETVQRVIWVPGSSPEPPEHLTAKIVPWIRVR